jgi:hypothetical protein
MALKKMSPNLIKEVQGRPVHRNSKISFKQLKETSVNRQTSLLHQLLDFIYQNVFLKLKCRLHKSLLKPQLKIDKLIPNFIRKCKESKIIQSHPKKNKLEDSHFTDFKTKHKATVIKAIIVLT